MSDVPGGPVVKTLPSNAEGLGLISGPGIKIHMPHDVAKKKPKNKTVSNTEIVFSKE